MKAAILYTNFMDPEGKERRVGGIETYLLNLGLLCLELGMEPIVFQVANKYFETHVSDINVIGLPFSKKNWRTRKYYVYRSVSKTIDPKKDLVIFGADRLAVRTKNKRCVSINHGIAFDLPVQCISPRKIWRNKWCSKLFKFRMRRLAIKAYKRCPNRVFVDYNFLNWYRTYSHSDLPGRNWVIPNFTSVAPRDRLESLELDNAIIRILFARRFTEYRGTRIMTQAAKKILGRHSNVEFTFAGEGPDENWLREHLGGESRVKFIKYLPHEIMDIHLKHHIAVIPSIASEGTSFSVAEGMGCGCAVVASAVGGITNMIIDGYNGLLCMPSAVDLEAKLEELISNGGKRHRIGERAYETAKEAFSHSRWKRSWSQVLEEVAGEK